MPRPVGAAAPPLSLGAGPRTVLLWPLCCPSSPQVPQLPDCQGSASRPHFGAGLSAVAGGMGLKAYGPSRWADTAPGWWPTGLHGF